MMTDSPPPHLPPRRRPSAVLLIFLLFPLLGLIAAGIFVTTNKPISANGMPATPEPVTLPPPKTVANSPMIDFTLTSLDGIPFT